MHVIGPEQGVTHPGKTIVCGDSHTSTHGAFGALAFGIGTSEVEHVLATQTLQQKRPKSMLVNVSGALPPGVTAKDLALGIIHQIGTDGGTGYAIEYAGPAIRALSMEGRMTLCNMAIESGARAGMIAPDETTYAYLKGRRHAPQGEHWERAVAYWRTLPSDPGAHFDAVCRIRCLHPAALGHLGNFARNVGARHRQRAASGGWQGRDRKALHRPRSGIHGHRSRPVAGGARRRSRLCRLLHQRAPRRPARGRQGHQGTQRQPQGADDGRPRLGRRSRRRAESEGLDRIFLEAGAEWREPGCSMCLAMNPDILLPGERCASTSNRNFEGRQGRGGRTHLVSPAMAAAAAVAGHFTDVRNWDYKE